MYKSFNVKTLGILEITHSKNVFPEQGKRSSQVELLVIYLIINRDKNITAKQLISFLWSDRENQVTIGALRNLVYRARKDLKKLYSKEVCILSKGHSYFWNPSIKCQVDYEKLMTLASNIDNLDQLDEQYQACLELIDGFENQFLPEFHNNEWIAQLNSQLVKNCLAAIFLVINNLQQANRYQDILRILEHPHIAKLENEVLFEKRLNTYYQLNQIDKAIDYYQNIINNYYLHLETAVPKPIQDLYQQCQNINPQSSIDIISLDDFINSGESIKGAFYCDYYVFKRIYQLNLVDIKHSNHEHALVMLTLQGEDLNQVSKESVRLKNILIDNLRKDDIVCKYNAAQYFLIIHASKLKGIESAITRIINYFNQEKQSEVALLQRIEPIKY
ncbi:hypothetical protein [Thomasclavelia sp.]|uniref:hypothetical protein n=1 Tax=Thomasclavelia sp. TaxID=3025757 RepID=UPI0025E02117|nr:hypothetical protein [Thomasclavelia sp.]